MEMSYWGPSVAEDLLRITVVAAAAKYTYFGNRPSHGNPT